MSRIREYKYYQPVHPIGVLEATGLPRNCGARSLYVPADERDEVGFAALFYNERGARRLVMR